MNSGAVVTRLFGLHPLDLGVIVVYIVVILWIGRWVARRTWPAAFQSILLAWTVQELVGRRVHACVGMAPVLSPQGQPPVVALGRWAGTGACPYEATALRLAFLPTFSFGATPAFSFSPSPSVRGRSGALTCGAEWANSAFTESYCGSFARFVHS